MKFEDLDKILPNGFHDAHLKNIQIDYVTKIAILSIHFIISEIPSKEIIWKSGRITLVDFEFFIIDSPDPRYSYRLKKPLIIDAGIGHPNNERLDVPEILPGNFLMWIWVHEWNGFIRIAAKDILHQWD